MSKDQEPRKLSEEDTDVVLDAANAQLGDLNDPNVQKALRRLLFMDQLNKKMPKVIIVLQTGEDGTPPKATLLP